MISRRKAFSWCGVGGLLLVLGGVLPGRVIEAVPRQDAVVARYAKDLPAAWGERLEGVRTRLATTDRVLALTLDACGGEYDEELVAFLIRERIPATLFLTGRWIDRHFGDDADGDGRPDHRFGLTETMSRALDTMQAQIARVKLALDPPELVIRIPRDACQFYEFWRAAELVEIGRREADKALDAAGY